HSPRLSARISGDELAAGCQLERTRQSAGCIGRHGYIPRSSLNIQPPGVYKVPAAVKREFSVSRIGDRIADRVFHHEKTVPVNGKIEWVVGILQRALRELELVGLDRYSAWILLQRRHSHG